MASIRSIQDDTPSSDMTNTFSHQIPHAYQQVLSAEKVPALGSALPAFEALKKCWEIHNEMYPETKAIVDQGLKRLQEYRNIIDFVPIYTLATRMYSIVYISDILWLLTCRIVQSLIHPKSWNGLPTMHLSGYKERKIFYSKQYIFNYKLARTRV